MAIQVVAANAALDGGKHEAVFIDTSTSNWQALVSGVEASRPGVAIELIDGGQNGLAQIATWAMSNTGYDAIHVLSQGGEATLKLGTDTLNNTSMTTVTTQAELSVIGQALKPGGEFLVYGSNVAAGSDGQAFMASLSTDTGGANVLAADHAVGDAGSGGTWTLNQSTRAVNVQALPISGYLGVLSNGTTATSSVLDSVQVQAANTSLDGGKLEVAFIDTSVTGWQSLVSGFESSNPGMEIQLLDGTQNGLTQIATWAATHSNYDAIHILSHGSEATMDLGTQNLSLQNLQSYTSQLSTIGNALNSNGDILLYGCDVAAGSDGASFVQTLAQDTHAVVAASTDLTGAASKGGNWTLEYKTGVLDVKTLSDVNYRDTLIATGTANGTYDFGATIGAANSAGTGFSTFSDKFVVSNGMATNVAPCTTTSVYVTTPTTAQSQGTFIIKAEGTTTCKTFTFNDLGVSFYTGGANDTLTQFAIVTKDTAGTTIATHSWTGSYVNNSPANTLFQASSVIGGGPWADNNVASVTITWTYGGATNPLDMNFENITVANVSAGATAPTVSSIHNDNNTSTHVVNAATDNFTVVFSAPVTGVAASNFTRTGTDGTGTIGTPTTTDGGTTWTVPVTGVSGNGTLGLNLTTATGITAVTGGLTLSATFNGTQTYTIDNTPPALTGAVTETSSNATNTLAKVGDTVTLGFTTDGTQNGAPTATIDGHTATITNTSGNNYTATYAMVSGDATGAVTFAINASDLAGNAMTAVTAVTSGSGVTFDKTPPALTAVTETSSNATSTLAKVGDTVTVAFTTDGTQNGTPTATIDGHVATVTHTSGNNYTATYAMVSGDTTGAVTFAINASDLAGNAMTAVTAVTSGSGVTFDKTAPALTGTVGIVSNNATNTLAKTGNLITVSFTTDGTQSGSPTATIDGNAATVTNTSGNNYTATYTMASGDATGAVTFAINAVDAAGNAMTAVTAVTNGSAVTYDKTAPTVTGVTLNASSYKLGDTVTATINTSAYDSNGTYTLSASTLDGTSLGSWVYTTGSSSGTASFVVSGAAAEVINGSVPVNIVVTDAAGNSSTAYTTAFTGKTIDTHAPTAVSVGSFTTSGSNLVGNCALASGSSVGTLTTTDATTGDSFTYTLGGADAASFTVVSGVLKVAGTALTNNQVYNITIQTTDLGGNQMGAAQAVVITALNAPSVSSINRSGTQVTNATSETFTVTFSAPVTGVSASNFALSGTDGTGTKGTPTTSDGGTTWTMVVTGVSGNGTLGLDLSSTAGITAVTGGAALSGTHTSDQTFTIDNTPPALTAVSIASNNATNTVAKTGDIVTVSFTTDGTQTGTPTATIDGHSATVTNTSGNNYTATYSMASGDASGAVTFAINAVDAVGNAMTPVTADIGNSSAVTFDKTAPVAATLVANNLSAPSASTFTFTVAYTDAGGIKAATIGTGNVTVTGPGSMGALTVTGASWNSGTATATYTVQAPHTGVWNSATDVGTYTIGIVAGSVTDAAGNAILASAGAATFSVAFVPTTTVTAATLSADTGSSSTDFLTKTAAQTISGTLSANLATGEFVQVSYDNGATWANATTSTVGSNTWSTTTTLAGSSTFEARVSNGGASSTAYTHAYTLDQAAPTVTGAASNQPVNDNATLHPFSSVVITESVSAADSQTVTITLDAAAKGALSNLGGGSYNATTGVYTFNGTAAQATAALQALVFAPTSQYVASGLSDTTTFTISSTNAAGNTVTNSSTSVSALAVTPIARPVTPPPPIIVAPLPPVIIPPAPAPAPIAAAVQVVLPPPPIQPVEIAQPAPIPMPSYAATTATTLVVDHGINNVSVAAGDSIAFTVPKNAFVDTAQNVQLTYKATLADGSPLPTWLTFNAATGSFSGTAPAGEKGDLHIKVDARDSKGNEASTTFTVKNGHPSDGDTPVKPAKPAAPQKQGALSGKDALAALGLGDFGLLQGEHAGEALRVSAPDNAAVNHAVAHVPHLSAQLQHHAHRFAHARATTLQHLAAVEASRIG